MIRQQILEQYQAENGIIRTPGRFEGEMLYVPHFWGIFLEGFADRDDGRTVEFDVTDEDRQEFPELKGRRTIRLFQREDGFVIED